RARIARSGSQAQPTPQRSSEGSPRRGRSPFTRSQAEGESRPARMGRFGSLRPRATRSAESHPAEASPSFRFRLAEVSPVASLQDQMAPYGTRNGLVESAGSLPPE